MNPSDVLIIGAGPVGLALASECQRNGVSFRIVDRAPSHSTHSKALAIWSGTLECLAALGLADTFCQAGRPIRNLIFEEQGKPLATVSCCEGLETAYPQPIILPQCDTEALLIDDLRRHGIEVERNVECLEIKQDDTGVECQLKHADGRVETARAAWLAGCDGARSLVRHSLPVEFPGVTEKVGFILADARVSGGLPTDSIVVSFSAESAVIIFPVKDDIWRIFALRPNTDDRSDPTLAEVQEHMDRAGLGNIHLADTQWLSFFAVNERVASRSRVGRVFLLGDASHIHSPAGGQGMNTGIQDAVNLGWKLKVLTSGRGDTEAVAESYFAERHPVAESVVRDTSRMLHFGIMNNALTRAVKRIALPFVTKLDGFRRFMAGELSELKISYPSSPLVMRDSKSVSEGIAPGSRARDVQVVGPAGRVSLWREFLVPGHTLVVFSGPQLDHTAIKSFAASFGIEPLVVWLGGDAPIGDRILRDPTGAAHLRYGMNNAGWYLIRPDQYVAARGALEETYSLREYLARIGQA